MGNASSLLGKLTIARFPEFQAQDFRLLLPPYTHPYICMMKIARTPREFTSIITLAECVTLFLGESHVRYSHFISTQSVGITSCDGDMDRLNLILPVASFRRHRQDMKKTSVESNSICGRRFHPAYGWSLRCAQARLHALAAGSGAKRRSQ